ncbi:DUF1616 domain-containing protein [Haloplanus halobius]|uniref:DUF1616 domain-containing protein n=1 Tax=Haloplanus halobius TaxID=2934938 RepID=UPI0020108321|nr:DUF1616 domain-containing protein [Haloplanus sp. XH21]
MDRTRAWRILVPGSVRRLPQDLQLVAGYLVIATAVVALPVVRTTLLRPALALPLVLFVPGYLFVAALFPEVGTAPDDTGDDAAERGIDGIERVALAFGTSIAIVPLLGLILNFTPFGIRLGPVMAALLLFCLVALAVAARRRQSVPAAQRFTVDVRGAIAAGWTDLTTAESRRDGALNVLLVCSVLLAAGSVGYAVAVPKQGEAFSELYLLTESEGGELVADDYPTDLTRGQPASLVVGIGNHEHEATEYTVVVALQRALVVNETGSNETTVQVQEQRELRRFDARVADNETWHRQHTIEPPMTGERLRLVYLLYRGPPPAAPSTENAYREVHLWVNVSSPDAQRLGPVHGTASDTAVFHGR